MPFQLFWALQEEAITSSLENLLEELAVITPTEKNKQQTIIHYSVFLYSKLLKKSVLTSCDITTMIMNVQRLFLVLKMYICITQIIDIKCTFILLRYNVNSTCIKEICSNQSRFTCLESASNTLE